MRKILVLGLGGVMACSAFGGSDMASEGLSSAPPSCGADGGGGPGTSDAGASQDGGASDAVAADSAAHPGAPGYLHTSGGDIVDASGHVVRLTGVSWFGLETANYAPHGLWSRSLGSMLDQIKSVGFNVIRLPFCSQLFDAGSAPNGIDANQNPDLVGLTGLQIMDKVVAGAKARGLKILLDRHRPDSGAQSALWYTANYSEQRWIDDWKMLASHYAGDPTVIGADLHNEPHGSATWGDGNAATDWRLAAERAGNAVLGVNPNWLIVVEGVENVGGHFYWWGGNLAAAGASPVRLNVPDRVVYSPHDYPSSIYAQSWFTDPSYPADLAPLWDQTWGYLASQSTAPVLIGEFGTKLQTASDKQWLSAMASYIGAHGLSFTFWAWNPDSGDTGGILADDWQTVNQDKVDAIKSVLAPPIP